MAHQREATHAALRETPTQRRAQRAAPAARSAAERGAANSTTAQATPLTLSLSPSPLPLTQATQEVEGLVFQMASGLAALKRLVDALGTPRDTVEHRRRLADANAKLQATAKRIRDALAALGADKAGAAAAGPQQQQKVRRLMQDFGAMLQDYKAAQKLAAEREANSLPRAPPAAAASAAAASAAAAAAAGGGGSSRDEEIERQGLLQARAMEEARALDGAAALNEALIEERDHGIQEIQRQIGEVNEMFQDLAVLINDQGQQLATVDDHIAATAERTREGARQLVKAERSQRAARNRCLLLWVVGGVIVALALLVVFGA